MIQCQSSSFILVLKYVAVATCFVYIFFLSLCSRSFETESNELRHVVSHCCGIFLMLPLNHCDTLLCVFLTNFDNLHDIFMGCMHVSFSLSLCRSLILCVHGSFFYRVNKWQMFCAVWHNFYYIYSGITTSKFTQQQLATHFSFMGSIKKRIPLMENHHKKTS